MCELSRHCFTDVAASLAKDGYVLIPNVFCEAKREAVAREYIYFFRSSPKFEALVEKEINMASATLSQMELMERVVLCLYRNFEVKELEDVYNITLPPSLGAELTEEIRVNTSKSVVDFIVDTKLGEILKQALSVDSSDEIETVPVQHIRLKPPAYLLANNNGMPVDEGALPRASVGMSPWHQDRYGYTAAADSTHIVTMWTPMTECSLGMGCLRVLRGSHKFGFQEHTPISTAMLDECHIPSLAVDLLKHNQGLEFIDLEAKPGDLVLLHPETIHCSHENVSDHVRMSMDLRFCRANSPRARPWFPCFNVGKLTDKYLWPSTTVGEAATRDVKDAWASAKVKLLHEKGEHAARDVNQSCTKKAQPVLVLSDVLPSPELETIGENFGFRIFKTADLTNPAVLADLRCALASDPLLVSNTIVSSLTPMMGPLNRHFFDATEDSVRFREILKPHFPSYYFGLADLSMPPPFDDKQAYIVKPVLGYASLNVSKISSLEEWQWLANGGAPPGIEFIVEEFTQGPEYLAVDCISTPAGSSPRTFQAVNVYQRYDRGIKEELNSTNAYVHAKYSAQLELFMGRVISVLPFPPSAPVLFNMEIIVRDDGSFFPVEINPFRWDGMATMQAAFKQTNPYGALVVRGFNPNSNLNPDVNYAVAYIRQPEMIEVDLESYKARVAESILSALPSMHDSAAAISDVVSTVQIDGTKCGGIIEARVMKVSCS